MVILSWMTIFFVEYGPYFDKDCQTSLFRRGERKQEGTLLEMDHIYVDGELVWDVDSTFDMKIGGMNFNFSRIVNADGEGYSFRVDEAKGALIRSQISGQ